MNILQSIVPPEASSEQVRLLIWIGVAVVGGLIVGMGILWKHLATREAHHDEREKAHTQQVQLFAEETAKFRALAEDLRRLLQQIHDDNLRGGRDERRPVTE